MHRVGKLGNKLGILSKSVSRNKLLLDILGGAVAVFSLTQLIGSAAKCIKVRRSSDNATLDIGFKNNYVDYEAMETFCGTGNGYVHTWYNQYSNGNNAIQIDNTKQPQIIANGQFILEGIYYTSDSFPISTYSDIEITTEPLSLYSSFNTYSSHIGYLLCKRDSYTQYSILNLNANISFRFANADRVQTPQKLGNNKILCKWEDGTDKTLIKNIDTESTATLSLGTITNQNLTFIGSNTDVSSFFSGYMSTMLISAANWENNYDDLRDIFELSILEYYDVSLVVAYSSLYKINKNYSGYAFEVTRDSDSTTLDIGFCCNYVDVASLLTFCAGTHGFISKWYDQSGNGNDVVVATNRQQIVNAGALVSLTSKRACVEPANSSHSLTDNLLAVNGRLKNLSANTYIVAKDSNVLKTGWFSPDYVSFINCSTGLMDFSITNGDNVYWWLVGNTESTANRPAVSLNAGVSFLFASNIPDSDIFMTDYATNDKYIGSLKDFSKLTNYLDLNSAINMTGDLADLGNRIIVRLALSGCVNITGDLSCLSSLTNYLNLGNLTAITGDIEDLKNITSYINVIGNSGIYGSLDNLHTLDYLLISGTSISSDLANCPAISTYITATNCAGIYGVFNPSSTISTIAFSGTSMTANDTDQTLINLDNNTAVTGTITTNGNRTTVSDVAVAALIGKGWTVID